MTERTFRFVLGTWLLTALYLDATTALRAFVALVVFEAVTSWRVPRLLTSLRRRARVGGTVDSPSASAVRPFEAERALRLLVAALVLLGYVALPTVLWWLPWLVGFALVGAAMSGMCPMALALHRVGLR